MTIDAKALELLDCPLSDGKGCEEWLLDWLQRKYLESTTLLLKTQKSEGEEANGTALLKSFMNLNCEELANLSLACQSMKLNSPAVIDKLLDYFISNQPQTKTCSLFPIDVLKLSQAVCSDEPAILATQSSSVHRPDTTGDKVFENIPEIVDYECIKSDAKAISSKMLSFHSEYEGKIQSWIPHSCSGILQPLIIISYTHNYSSLDLAGNIGKWAEDDVLGKMSASLSLIRKLKEK